MKRDSATTIVAFLALAIVTVLLIGTVMSTHIKHRPRLVGTPNVIPGQPFVVKFTEDGNLEVVTTAGSYTTRNTRGDHELRFYLPPGVAP